MPLARIEVRRARSPEEVQAIIEAVYQAQLEALRLPTGDRLIRYVAHAPEHFAVPPGKSANFTLVEYQLFPGRSVDAKRRLYEGIIQRLGALGIAPTDILVVIQEPSLDNWGIGGRPASELDLGFDLNV
ncbi:tautomerase family protein [Rhizobacter sp. LjRoot28]|jgi:phenylpyruvate tautomerase PptA (4-oxalocrotonate tautomerase family)|uniref:tautomerase family protein n=1 Tax=Rhizobacter sp. LjRoot28 TaxID=3342309 RepID=UPI003ECD0E2A